MLDFTGIESLIQGMFTSLVSLWNYMMGMVTNFLNLGNFEEWLASDANGVGIIDTIFGIVEGPALALFMLFWIAGIMKVTAQIADLKRPEVWVKHILRGSITLICIENSVTIVKWVWDVSHYIQAGLTTTVLGEVDATEILTAVESSATVTTKTDVGLGIASDICVLILIIFVLIGGYLATIYCAFSIFSSVFRRFFMMGLYCCVAPLAASTVAAEDTQRTGLQFLKNVIATSVELIFTTLLLRLFASFATKFCSTGIIDVALGMDVVNLFPHDSVAVLVATLVFIFCLFILHSTIKMMNSLEDSLLGIHGV